MIKYLILSLAFLGGCATMSSPYLIERGDYSTWEPYGYFYSGIPSEMPEHLVYAEEKGDKAQLQDILNYLLTTHECRRTGRIVVKALIDVNGYVIEPRVVESLGTVCDDLAVNAVKIMAFHPATLNEEPVQMVVRLPLTIR